MFDKIPKSKWWGIKTREGKRFRFYPIFDYDEKEEEVVCNGIAMRDPDGKDHVFNYDNLFQFIYFIGNETVRKSLSLRMQKRVNYIPYEIGFKLDKEEIEKGSAKRRIEVPIDSLTMAIARNESLKLKEMQEALKGRNKLIKKLK